MFRVWNGTMTHSKMTHSKMSLSVTTFSIKGKEHSNLEIKKDVTDIEHNNSENL
jgi:hypothetical protein